MKPEKCEPESQAVALTNLEVLAGKAIHERLGLCLKLLEDKEYVAEGDPATRLDQLEKDFFGDLGGALSLAKLLEVYRAFPEKAQWEKHDWNLSRLIAEWDRTRPRRKPRINVLLEKYAEIQKEHS